LRQKIGVVYGNPETTTGGNALKFYATVRLDIRKIGIVKNGEIAVGSWKGERIAQGRDNACKWMIENPRPPRRSGHCWSPGAKRRTPSWAHRRWKQPPPDPIRQPTRRARADPDPAVRTWPMGRLAVVWAGGRVFRVGLLLQGKPPRPMQLLRWILRG
jgi:hypothetical protein